MTVLSYPVACLGQAANTFLAQGQDGKVLATLNHAVYLLTGCGELFWLTELDSPRHRRCILIHAPLPSPAVGSTFTTGNRWIRLETGTKLDFRGVEIWQAPPVPPGQVIPPGSLPDKLFSVLEIFPARESPAGFGLMIRPVLQIARKESGSPDFSPGDVFSRHAWPLVEQIARACIQQDLPGVLKEAAQLVGLGDGLTPAGDDFLGGLFFACTQLLSAFPTLMPLEFPNLQEWIEAVLPRTNLISYTLLKDNIAGHALEPLQRFGMALLTNRPLEIALSAASDLIRVGHSTGWSLLAGFVTGMLPAFNK
jgi:hypothetical protein